MGARRRCACRTPSAVACGFIRPASHRPAWRSTTSAARAWARRVGHAGRWWCVVWSRVARLTSRQYLGARSTTWTRTAQPRGRRTCSSSPTTTRRAVERQRARWHDPVQRRWLGLTPKRPALCLREKSQRARKSESQRMIDRECSEKWYLSQSGSASVVATLERGGAPLGRAPEQELPASGSGGSSQQPARRRRRAPLHEQVARHHLSHLPTHEGARSAQCEADQRHGHGASSGSPQP